MAINSKTSILIGSTGFVGSHLAKNFQFSHSVNSSTINDVIGMKCELLVCAGLPAAKWKANTDPLRDLENTKKLARDLSSIESDRAILISTIDVYQPPVDVDEAVAPNLEGPETYGFNRGWFEFFFTNHFKKSSVVRLPGLFAPDVRKNLIHDLLFNRDYEWAGMNPDSRFQFFNLDKLWEVLNFVDFHNIKTININSEPISAAEIGNVFFQKINGKKAIQSYDVKSQFATLFGGSNGYLYSKAEILSEIKNLRIQVQNK